jgi:hypothetical protein
MADPRDIKLTPEELAELSRAIRPGLWRAHYRALANRHNEDDPYIMKAENREAGG